MPRAPGYLKQSCARLGTWSNCARAEVLKAIARAPGYSEQSQAHSFVGIGHYIALALHYITLPYSGLQGGCT
eukprot:7979503-Karenia_brevis.AAC.1